MAYDEALADRVRDQVGDDAVEKKMFGGVAFLVGGNMAIGVSGQGGLMVRCDPAETDALVSAPAVTRMEMRGRAMDGWLRVTPESVAADDELGRWVRVGREYAQSLPPK